MTQGYYSLIQYCPDWTRLEICNLGVVLLCPEIQYLDAMVVQGYSRVKSIFGKEHVPYVKMFKDRFAQRIRNERENILNLDGLKMFISQRANYFRMTEPRSMAVESNPDEELQHLFREIFAGKVKPQTIPHPAIKTRLRKMIKEYGVSEERVLFNVPKIQVPGFPKTTGLRPCLGFMNGRFNIVVYRYLTAKNSLDAISRCLFTGQKLFEHPDEIWGKQQLNVLVETDDNDVIKQVKDDQKHFDAHKVKVYASVDDMARAVNDEAKEIPEHVRAQISVMQSA